MAEVSRPTADAAADVIHDETSAGANTAARVGQALIDIVASTLWKNYGLAAARPASSTIVFDTYFATDTGVLSIWDGSSWITVGGGAGSDTDAIHDNVAGEIAAIAEKAAPVSADKVLIEDSEDGDSKKYTEIGNLPAGTSFSTLAELNAIVTDATLDDSGDPRDPNAHASTHEDGGGDALDGGNLAYAASPTNYTPDSSTIGGHFIGVDAALGNKSDTSHNHAHNSLTGLTTGDPHTQYTLAPGAVADNRLVRFDGTSGRATQMSSATEDDSGNVSGWTSIAGFSSLAFFGVVATTGNYRVPHNHSGNGRNNADNANHRFFSWGAAGTDTAEWGGSTVPTATVRALTNVDILAGGAVVVSVTSAQVEVSQDLRLTDAPLEHFESGAGTNEKLWDETATGDVLTRRTRTDADGAGATYEEVEREGTAVSRIRHTTQYAQAETVDSFSVEVDTADSPAASSLLRDKAGNAVALSEGFTYEFHVTVETNDGSIDENGKYLVPARRRSGEDVELGEVLSSGAATTSGLDMQFAEDTGNQYITCQPTVGGKASDRKVRWSVKVERRTVVTVDA
jgi:hypothetical protein